jgi:putative transposase
MAKKRYAESANQPLTQKRYMTDCTDKEWTIIEPLTRKNPGPGRKRRVNLREVVNAIFYRTRTGCQWRMFPKEFPARSTIWYYYNMWTEDGTWDKINATLRRMVRRSVGKQDDPSLAIIDSQTVKATESGGERGYDGAKQVNGRKRHIMVDTLGLLLLVMVHAADIQDYIAAESVLTSAYRRFTSLLKVIADTIYGYNGLPDWVKTHLGFVLEIIKRDPQRKGFYPLKKRWIVERSLAWFGRNRILSKEYERRTESSESDVYIASIRLMLRRLDRAKVAG